MKIFGSDTSLNQAKVDEIRNRGRGSSEKSGGKSEASSGSRSSSTVSVSGMAREIGKANASVRVAPDIRKEKVDAIREQVESGQYHVAGDKIADKIIEDIISQAK